MVKKKHVEEPHEDHADETWLIPYSDLLTLLLALFIVLFASSSLDKKKAAMISATFSQAFSSNSAGQLYGGLMDFLDDAGGLGLGEGISLGTDNRGVVIEISAISLFDEDDVKIKSQIIPDLEKIATLLNDPRYRRFQIMVEGHTDDTPSKKYTSNWDLSALRAFYRYLMTEGCMEQNPARGVASLKRDQALLWVLSRAGPPTWCPSCDISSTMVPSGASMVK